MLTDLLVSLLRRNAYSADDFVAGLRTKTDTLEDLACVLPILPPPACSGAAQSCRVPAAACRHRHPVHNLFNSSAANSLFCCVCNIKLRPSSCETLCLTLNYVGGLVLLSFL